MTSKHLVGSASVHYSKRRRIQFSEGNLVVDCVKAGVVVSFHSAHEVQTRDALLTITLQTVFNILESASFGELIEFLVNLTILVVNLYLVKRLVSKPFGMQNEPTLGKTANLIVVLLFLIILVLRRITNHF